MGPFALPRFFSKPWWLGFFVALAAFVLYLPTLGYDFVYDSVVQVGVDDFIHQPRHLVDCLTLRVLGEDVLDFNRPVNLVSLIADAALWGKNPAGFRLTNLFLHAAVAAVLFRWLVCLTGSPGASFFAALLFVLHPVHVETVVEVGYREDLLVTFFLLAGLNAAAAFRPVEGPARRVWGPGALAAACFFLAAASKENGIAGPVALAAYWALLRRGTGESRRAWLVLIGVSTGAVAAFYGLRFGLEPRHSLIFTQKPPRMAVLGLDWLLVQCQIWTAGFCHLFWPAGLCADYGPYNLRAIGPLTGLVTVAVLGIGAAVLSGGNRRAALGCVLAASALLPVANLVPIYKPMADRYFYLPLTGLALLAALALASAGKSARWRLPAYTAAGLAAVALAAVTLWQEPFWRDGTALWAETARRNPFSVNAWGGRGDAAYDQGRYAEALGFYLKADELARGKSALICGGLALAWEGLHEPKKAAQALQRATKLDSRFKRPETLPRALVYPEPQAQRLSIIKTRLDHP